MLPDALAIVPSDRPSWNVQGHQRSAPLWALMRAGPGSMARRDMKFAQKNLWLHEPLDIQAPKNTSGGIWMCREPWKSDDWFTNAYDKSGVMCRICFELVNNKFLVYVGHLLARHLWTRLEGSCSYKIDMLTGFYPYWGVPKSLITPPYDLLLGEPGISRVHSISYGILWEWWNIHQNPQVIYFSKTEIMHVRATLIV